MFHQAVQDGMDQLDRTCTPVFLFLDGIQALYLGGLDIPQDELAKHRYYVLFKGLAVQDDRVGSQRERFVLQPAISIFLQRHAQSIHGQTAVDLGQGAADPIPAFPLGFPVAGQSFSIQADLGAPFVPFFSEVDTALVVSSFSCHFLSSFLCEVARVGGMDLVACAIQLLRCDLYTGNCT